MGMNWIKMRTGLDSEPRVNQLAGMARLPIDQTIFALYRVAGWFNEHGNYGLMVPAPELIDHLLKLDGFGYSMRTCGLLEVSRDAMFLVWYCDVSSQRKGLGKRVRAKILAGASCAACGTKSKLVIDHKIPISRGGTCELDNLQALCQPCNSRKGTRTMQEFTNDYRS